ncbi:MAG: UDP-3-O-(3-hydroxymyristoyl)glucosamine N-acyltransferase [Nitrospirae bacterium]|nr:MAG: UDP-3-O-(3-hydroxymyristoyl)glucosamine N-acyltransferase [Nitrospirota bacterium]
MKLSEIAALVNGSIKGDADLLITGVAGISNAAHGDITFLAGTKALKELKRSKASAVLVVRETEELEQAQVVVRNPQYAFAQLLEKFHPRIQSWNGTSKDAFVSENAVLDKDVTVYPFAFIGDGVRIGAGTVIYPGVFIGAGSSIGSNCTFYPNSTVREGITIGNNVILHAGAVIGADGFGYVFENGRHNKIPQVGGVIIEDDVEIGANTTIDRATTGNTVIGKGAKIDNLVQVGHNVRVGRHVILVAQTGIGGSSEIGDGVLIGGQVAVADHTKVEAGAMIGARAGLMGTVPKGIFSGAPAIPHRDWLKSCAVFAVLPELKKKVAELEEKLKRLSPDENEREK